MTDNVIALPIVRPDPEFRPLMSYSRVPTTDSAFEFVETIADEIEATENRQRARKEYDRIRFVDTVGRFLADLVVTIAQGPYHCRSFPRGNNYYGQDTVPVNRKKAVQIYDGLVTLGLLKSVIGSSYNRDTGQGYCEVIAPTDALRERIKQAKVGDINLHWSSDKLSLVPDNSWLPVIVKTMKGRNSTGLLNKSEIILGAHLTAKGKEETKRMEERNNFIRGFPITGPELLGWQRQFVLDLDNGGRLYAKPSDHSYQNLPKLERHKMQVDGMRVNEIDITASHLYFYLSKRLVDIHERMKQHNLSDPYSIPNKESREHVKLYITTMFGQGKHPEKWPKGHRAQLGYKPPHISNVRERLLVVYPELLNLDRNWYWPKLHKIESDAILAAMDRLRGYGVPSYPVHDSLIVPVESTMLAIVCLRGSCEAIAGFPPLPFKISREQKEVWAAPVVQIEEIEEMEVA